MLLTLNTSGLPRRYGFGVIYVLVFVEALECVSNVYIKQCFKFSRNFNISEDLNL